MLDRSYTNHYSQDVRYSTPSHSLSQHHPADTSNLYRIPNQYHQTIVDTTGGIFLMHPRYTLHSHLWRFFPDLSDRYSRPTGYASHTSASLQYVSSPLSQSYGSSHHALDTKGSSHRSGPATSTTPTTVIPMDTRLRTWRCARELGAGSQGRVTRVRVLRLDEMNGINSPNFSLDQ